MCSVKVACWPRMLLNDHAGDSPAHSSGYDERLTSIRLEIFKDYIHLLGSLKPNKYSIMESRTSKVAKMMTNGSNGQRTDDK
jgi:hypothetical protein